MTVRELMEHLAEADPEAEVVGGVWNGRINTCYYEEICRKAP